MKVWIERREVAGSDGWPVERYDVVTAEGDSVLGGLAHLCSGAHEAKERARAGGHQVMTIPRPKKRR